MHERIEENKQENREQSLVLFAFPIYFIIENVNTLLLFSFVISTKSQQGDKSFC